MCIAFLLEFLIALFILTVFLRRVAVKAKDKCFRKYSINITPLFFFAVVLPACSQHLLNGSK